MAPRENDPDALLAGYLLRQLRADELVPDYDSPLGHDASAHAHLRSCTDTRVRDATGIGGQTDTGVEFVTLSCLAGCPHTASQQYTYGEWGELADLLAALEDEAAAQ